MLVCIFHHSFYDCDGHNFPFCVVNTHQQRGRWLPNKLKRSSPPFTISSAKRHFDAWPSLCCWVMWIWAGFRHISSSFQISCLWTYMQACWLPTTIQCLWEGNDYFLCFRIASHWIILSFLILFFILLLFLVSWASPLLIIMESVVGNLSVHPWKRIFQRKDLQDKVFT